MFSFSGTTDRGSFVLASIGWTIINSIAVLLSFSGNVGALAVAFIVGIMAFFALLSLTVRRMRDMGFSGLGMFIVIIAYTVFCWTIIVPIICWIFLAVMPSVASAEVLSSTEPVLEPVPQAQPTIPQAQPTISVPNTPVETNPLATWMFYGIVGLILTLVFVISLTQ